MEPQSMFRYPFLKPEFFAALEESGSTSSNTGWDPKHIVLERDGTEQAFLPLYEKSHSYGEYVFDWAWANAYHRNGIDYYPKLITAIPFTPATGPRVRFSGTADSQQLATRLIDEVIDLAGEVDASSWHLLFPDKNHLALFQDERLMLRSAVQYHWHNRDYDSFDQFLAEFNSRKRKMVKKERRGVSEQGFVIRRLTGEEITPEDWHIFALFYQRTYLKRSGSRGYLTPEFFSLLGKSMAEQCLMITAHQGDQPIAAAFYLFDDATLYGRYWGCLQEFDFLHFELCYYQGIEFAIERGLSRFDAGAQGEHKIVRGFEPVLTHSLHWIREPAYAAAIARFLKEEEPYIRQHMEQARAMLPFKSGD
jgi:uncharacterized protein